MNFLFGGSNIICLYTKKVIQSRFYNPKLVIKSKFPEPLVVLITNININKY